MLTLNIIIIPILGGFLFVKYSYITNFRAVRDNGYLILLKSSVIGLFFYGIAYISWKVVIFDTDANPKILEFVNSLHNFLDHSTLFPTLLSLLFMLIFVLATNYILDKDEMKKRVIRQDDDALEITLLQAYDKEKNILVTLENGKIYIGKVTDTYFRINDEIRSVLLNPLVSGYRDKKDFTLTFTTYYGKIYEHILNNPEEFNTNISDFSVALRFDKILSISPFDPLAYQKFKNL